MDDLQANIFSKIGLTFIDYPDPSLPAVIVYFLGCDHNCFSCHNPDFQNINYRNKKLLSINDLYLEIIKLCNISKTNLVVFSGGDPLNPFNRDFVRLFINKYKYNFRFCIYTGYDIDYVKKYDIKGFTFLKCGKYDSSLHQVAQKTNDFIQFASKNQILYDKDFNVVSKNGRYYF